MRWGLREGPGGAGGEGGKEVAVGVTHGALFLCPAVVAFALASSGAVFVEDLDES